MKTTTTNDLLLEQIAEDIIKAMEDGGLTADERLAVIQTIKMRFKLNYYSSGPYLINEYGQYAFL